MSARMIRQESRRPGATELHACVIFSLSPLLRRSNQDGKTESKNQSDGRRGRLSPPPRDEDENVTTGVGNWLTTIREATHTMTSDTFFTRLNTTLDGEK